MLAGIDVHAPIVAVNGIAYFPGRTDDGDYQLWRSDGTPAGTSLLKAVTLATYVANPGHLFNDNGTLFFSGSDASRGSELWKSDGTPAGTVLVKDIFPGPSGSSPSFLAVVNGDLYFDAFDGAHRGLWKTDGTTAGTVKVSDVRVDYVEVIGGPTPPQAANVAGTLFFRGDDGAHGVELWKSDGTAAGTALVKDIAPPGVRAGITFLTNVNGAAFFAANDGAHGYELWKSDGTSGGTVLVKDTRPGSAEGPVTSTGPRYLAEMNGKVYFSANDGTSGYELWRSDGTTSGTLMVQDLSPGSRTSIPGEFININGTLFFKADSVSSELGQVWKSDGTSAGTVLIKNTAAGANSALLPRYFTNASGELYFSAWTNTKGGALWTSDGTTDGTILVKNFPDSQLGDAEPLYLAAAGGSVFFAVSDGTGRHLLWTSDGTTNGTSLLMPGGGPINHPPVITSNGGGDSAAVSIPENTTAVANVQATDPDAGTALTYSLAGGADAARFSIDSASGVLTFLAAPDFENPADADHNNVYSVIVQASDGIFGDMQTIAVTVTNVNDEPPVITSNGGGATASVSVPENTIAVTDVNATDGDGTANLVYSKAGGVDAAKFVINQATGVLTFITSRDFESPTDADADNVYEVIVRVSDGSLSATQTISVAAINVNEPPVITSNGGGDSAYRNLFENTITVAKVAAVDPDASTTLTYSLTGTDAARFAIDPVTDILTFVAPPDFENPTDADANNNYLVTVQVSDGSLKDTQSFVVAVLDNRYEQSTDCSTVVLNADDSGDGSLRAAITCANGKPGLDTISFDIPGIGVQTIRPIAALPALTDPVIIDGFTQPGATPNRDPVGFNGRLLIELKGPTATNTDGLLLETSNSTIRGLIINQTRVAGIRIVSDGPLVASNNIIEGNFLGTDASGNLPLLNSTGIEITATSDAWAPSNHNVIGGPDPAERNVISGNGIGISLSGSGIGSPSVLNTVIQGNFIGTTAAGGAALANAVDGISIKYLTSGTMIGGSGPGEGNLISGNRYAGIALAGSQATCTSASSASADSTGNVIQGNKIGTDVTGTQPLGNGANGITVGFNSPSGSIIGVIGGTAEGQGNTIAFNGLNGIGVLGGSAFSSRITIVANSIFENAQLGISLGTNCAATPNDTGDIDRGPNGFQNFPVLTSAAGTTSRLNIAGMLNSAADTTYRIEFFSSAIVDPSGYGEGQTFIGFMNVATDAGGNTPEFVFSAVGNFQNKFITATATKLEDAGQDPNTPLVPTDTSEFSASLKASIGCSTGVINTNDSGPGSLRSAITCANDTTGTDTIAFNIPGTGAHTISPLSPLPTITEAVIIDGYTQPGASPNTQPIDDPDPARRGLNAQLLIELSGAQAGGSGLTLAASNSTIRGLVINGFATDGVVIDGGSNNLIAGNLIGTDSTGTQARPNGHNGVFIFDGASNNIIGTNGDNVADPAERNLISGNLFGGVAIAGAGTDSNRVAGNLIGTNITGTAGLGNAHRAVDVVGGGKHNIVGTNSDGSDDAAERNVLSGNGWDGVVFSGVGTSLNIAAGNIIGLDAGGTADLGNTLNGVGLFDGATGNIIGGAAPLAGNIISGNDRFGVSITDAGTSYNVVSGNYIGTNAAGSAAIANAHEGVRIELGASQNTIGFDSTIPAAAAGNVISGNGAVGVQIRGSSTNQNVVAGNLIGTDALGLAAIGNAQSGVRLELGAAVNRIGTNGDGASDEAERNVISGNLAAGVAITDAGTNNNIVAGNFIGTDSTGASALGNAVRGVNISSGAQFNRIGTDANGIADVAERNVISGNLAAGVSITDAGTDNNVVAGNFIGTNSTGTSALGNSLRGVSIYNGAQFNRIGTNADGIADVTERNVISGNGGQGVQITDAGTSHNTVAGNFIGTDVTGSLPLGNGVNGVWLSGGATANTIGGTVAAAANTIAFNTGNGVIVTAVATTGNAILGNSIFQNTKLGIDLGGDGVTPNDDTNSDTGPNRLQNFPIVDSATTDGSILFLHFQVPSDPGQSAYPLRVELFKADSSGQGRTFLGASAFTSSDDAAGGKFLRFVPAAPLQTGDKIVATATDNDGNTSEFSLAAGVEPLTTDLAIYKWAAPDRIAAGGAVTWSILVTNVGNAAAANVSVLDVLPPQVHFVSARQVAGPAFTLQVPAQDSVSGDFVATAPSLGVGEFAVFTVAVSIDSSVASDTEISNTAIVTTTTADTRPDNNLSTSVVHVGMSLDCSPLQVGVNACTVSGATPGGIVGLVLGAHAGSSVVAPFSVTVGISDPRIIAQGVVQPGGTALMMFNVAAWMPLENLLLQAFEQAPRVQATNLVTVGAAQHAAGGQASGATGSTAGTISDSDLPALVAAAISRWQAAGISIDRLAELHAATVEVADLSSGMLGQTIGDQVFIDPSAAGYGWFVDATPADDHEFDTTATATELTSAAGTAPAGRIDLLTVLMHELGHVMGLADLPASQGHALLSDPLATGIRRLPDGAAAVGAVSPVGQFHQNPVNSLDTNGDGAIAPSDALVVINALNQGLQAWLLARGSAATAGGGPFLDVNGDSAVSPADALMVINYLNQHGSSAANAEGEAGNDLIGIETGQVSPPPKEAAPALLTAKAIEPSAGLANSELAEDEDAFANDASDFAGPAYDGSQAASNDALSAVLDLIAGPIAAARWPRAYQ
jgi:titin